MKRRVTSWNSVGAADAGGRTGKSADRPVLITGGAGFVGSNLAHRLLEGGRSVLVLDNLSRPGVERNLQWLRDTHGSRLEVEVADVCDAAAVRRAVAQAGQVFHLAAQVAVTTSLADPVRDFEVNARGTLNVLEAIRSQPNRPPLVFTSTNKVYGGLEDLTMALRGRRYEPTNASIKTRGIGESRPLDFHSPYGCSKGAADQYVLDYARSFELPAVVLRMSCIYGPHQFGTEDQGWVAHFLIRAIKREPITLYGDGMQVRDVLFVDDLVDAFVLAQEHMPAIAGEAFNIGGGPANTTSLLELMSIIDELHGECPELRFDSWRTGDQRYYVTDTRKFADQTGWGPRVTVRDGVARLYAWLLDTHHVPRRRVVASAVAVTNTEAATSTGRSGDEVIPRARAAGEARG
jgi:CDP-paratose 2-epimerase